MKIDSLRKFLITSNKKGYAAGDNVTSTKEKDGSKTITYKEGNWSFHDNFFGGEPYGGREVIFYKGKPVWIMVYYGWVEKKIKDIDSVYAFLQKSLANAPDEYPYRGPKELKEKNYSYENEWSGELNNFSGKEVINVDGNKIYEATYIGGLVDN